MNFLSLPRLFVIVTASRSLYACTFYFARTFDEKNIVGELEASPRAFSSFIFNENVSLRGTARGMYEILL